MCTTTSLVDIATTLASLQELPTLPFMTIMPAIVVPFHPPDLPLHSVMLTVLDLALRCVVGSVPILSTE